MNAPTLAGRLAAWCERQPRQEALVDAPDRAAFLGGAPRRLTYAQAWAESRSLAAVLLAHGLRRGDVLCMQLPNCNEAVLAYVACALLGVVISPVPVQYREHELGHILGLTRASAFMSWCRGDGDANPQLERARVLARAQAARSGRGVRVFAWQTGALQPGDDCIALLPGAADAAQLAALDRHLLAHPPDLDAAFTICWTSGTESLPKGVPRTHRQWELAPQAVVEATELFPGARLLNPFPLSSTGCLSGMLYPWLLTGGTLVQHQPFKLDVFLAQLRAEAIDYTCAAPALLASLLQDEALASRVDFKRLRRIASGGAPLSEWLVGGFAERFGVAIVNCYGSTEGAALYSSRRDVPDAGERARYFPRLGTPAAESGLAIARLVRTRLVDPDTGEVIEEPGRPGELRVQGPNVFHGYLDAPAQTAAAFDAEGYYRTGDLFEIAGARRQFYKFVGRCKEIVIRGGVNISSAEVENLVLGHPAVREAAVIGWPDPRLGERVCAVVVPREGRQLTLAALADWLREHGRMAAYKLPEKLVLADSLPRNPMGKVLKRELRGWIELEEKKQA